MSIDEKLKKMLVVDDTPQYLELAKEVARNTELANIDFYNNFEEALKELDKGDYKAVITDLFEGEDLPKGLLVYKKCIEKNIPVTIATQSTNRHAGAHGAIRALMVTGYSHILGGREKILGLLERIGLNEEEMEKYEGISKERNFDKDIFDPEGNFRGYGCNKGDKNTWKRLYEWATEK